MSSVDHCLPLSSPLVHVDPRCRCVVGRSVFTAVVTTRSRCDPLPLCRRSISVSRCHHHSFTLRPAVVVSSIDHCVPLSSPLVHVTPRCRCIVGRSSVDHCLPLSSPLVHVAPRCRCVVGRSSFPALVTARSRYAPLSLCRRSIIVSISLSLRRTGITLHMYHAWVCGFRICCDITRTIDNVSLWLS